jgi:hypothetical protein
MSKVFLSCFRDNVFAGVMLRRNSIPFHNTASYNHGIALRAS